MPFQRPTLTELIDRVANDISSRLIGVEGAVLRRSLAGILARSEAGAVHLLYGYLDWIAKQAMPDTAEDEYLDRWASIWLEQGRKAAAFAAGSVPVAGTDGSVIPAGWKIQRPDGVTYEVQADATIASGVATVSVVCDVAGVDGNVAIGTRMTLSQPITGVTSSSVLVSAITGGVDIESNTRLRERLLVAIRQPSQGGAEHDYINWALEVAGVTRAWCYPMAMGLGTVTVMFVVDDDPGGIIPDAPKVAEVLAYIEARRPVTAEVFVVAPVAAPLDATIKISPNTSAVQAAVTAELDDAITRDAEPNGTTYISRLREAVSIATGEANNLFVTPTADVTHSGGQIATPGTYTFQSFP